VRTDRPRRIAIVHSFYSRRTPSGENVVVEAQLDALTQAGHTVELVAQRAEDREASRTYPLQAAATAASGFGPSPIAELERFRPDVVHVHNLFPNFGTRWLRHWPGPIVATLHNFRPLCSNGYLFRDGEVCTLCVDGSSVNAVRHKCFHDSAIATAPVAWRTRRGVPGDAVLSRADATIVLSERSQEIFLANGYDAERMHLVPNFADDPYGDQPATDHPSTWLFAGRISAEKGILGLAAAWPAEETLDVAGYGPQTAELRAASGPSVRLLGGVEPGELARIRPGYEALIIPSLWFEGAPLVFVEALAAGLPVIALAGSGAADSVAAHGVGVVVPRPLTADGVRAAMAEVRHGGAALRKHCREVYARHFAKDVWVRATEAVYDQVLD
jgi:glycosyltransferase involved in cell wall biosynthesis